MKTVLVTGANGFLGSAICDELAANGYTVRGLVRDSSRYPFRASGIQLFKADLPDSVDAAAFTGVDIVIHAAYMTQFTNLAEAQRVNHEGTLRVQALSREAGVAQFVFISSAGVSAEAESYYSRSKYALEQIMDPHKDTIIRPGFIIGPGSGGPFNRMKDTLRQTGIVPIFDGGHQILQTIHIEDLCKAIRLAVEKQLTGILVVAEPDGVEMRDFFKRLGEYIGRSPRLVPLPLLPLLLMLRITEKLGIKLPISSENLLGLKHLKHMPSADSLARIGIEVRSAEESLRAVLGG